MTLLAVPNFSVGRDRTTIEAISVALNAHAALLDIHSDADHNRTVYTLAGRPRELSDALVAGARVARDRIDMSTHQGAHPHIGALDVAPIVFLEPADRGRAAATALVTADRIGHELGIPVFLYGALTDHQVTRAALRRGGPSSLASAIAAGDATPDFGPPTMHRRAGATLVAARPPLLAFNVELAPPANVDLARKIAAEVRRLPGVVALGVELSGPVFQVSTNIEDPDATSPADVVAAVAAHAPVQAAEIVGLPPARYFSDFPASVPLRNRRWLEERLPS